MRRSRALRIVASSILLFASAAAAGSGEISLELLGVAEIPGDLSVDGTLVGGLSGLAYDPGCDLFYAVSDDRGSIDPIRFYTVRVQVGPPVAVDVLSATVLRAADGGSVARGELDLEAAALAPDGSLYLASEGGTTRGVQPSVVRIALDGTLHGELALPEEFLNDEAGKRGVRNNLAFESAAVTGDGRLVLVSENALLQDGPEADLGIGSPSRMLVIDLSTERALAEYLYPVDPVPDVPRPPTAFRTNGVSEVLDIDDHRLLVVERAFSAGVGNRVRLFLVDTSGADDIRGVDALAGSAGAGVRPVEKTLVADLSDFGVRPDNIEGGAFGPLLTDGRRLLVMVADNNFQPSEQTNQVLLFAVAGVAPPTVVVPRPRVGAIQGSGHVSPYVGRCVAGTEGVVTAILGSRSGQAFWVQDPDGDGDASTSDGLLVTAPAGLQSVAVGDLVRIAGRVEERSWGLELPVTRLFATSVEVAARGLDLPPPVTIGDGGLVIPQPEIAAPGLASFDPNRFAADAFETLEGMRVRVQDPVVVGPTSRHGELAVLADGGRGAEQRTSRGGLRLMVDNPNPQRILIDDAVVHHPPALAVGDTLAGAVEGVLHYTYGAYKVVNTEPLPEAVSGKLGRERSGLRGDDSHLTLATFNLENLSAVDDGDRFERLAEVLVERLGCPDIVAVQEIQDDSGPEDDATVVAVATMARVVEAVEAAGGVRYVWRSVDPVDGESGGQPGANIRSAFLVNPARVEFVDRGICGAKDGVGVAVGPTLTCSPGLLDPSNAAFAARTDGEGGSRKPLVGEFRFAGKTIFVVNLHLASKGGDDPLFGRRQPPQEKTSARRVRQAEAVVGFVADVLAADPAARVVVAGDLNDFEHSAPLAALEGSGMTNLALRVPEDDRYTYVYLGNSQVLDHVLASPALADAAEVDAVHLAAEFPATDRVSDHDPILVRFAF